MTEPLTADIFTELVDYNYKKQNNCLISHISHNKTRAR